MSGRSAQSQQGPGNTITGGGASACVLIPTECDGFNLMELIIGCVSIENMLNWTCLYWKYAKWAEGTLDIVNNRTINSIKCRPLDE